MTKKILGVKIDDLTLTDSLTKVLSWLPEKKKSRTIVTPGPEFLVTAQKDEQFKKMLNNADLSLPDGFGLHLGGIKNRVAGIDFMLKLCELSAQNNWKVGLLGGQKGVAQITASKLIKTYPNINIAFKIDGQRADEVLANLKVPKVDLLFVAFGHPRQEKLLWALKESFFGKERFFKVGMGVGGAFDYISGQVPAAPEIFRFLGLEWAWRLLTQKNRGPRIFNAVVIFPFLLLKERLRID